MISQLQQYKLNRLKLVEQAAKTRILCVRCLQPDYGCYCGHIQRFDPKIEFVILIHPIEVRRRIATGRMSHLILENSHLISGENYTDHPLVNELIQSQSHQSVILSPGQGSVDLTTLTAEERKGVFLPEKPLRIFVLDGTWATAGKMLRRSENLIHLPRICFTPNRPSNFRVRKQPAVTYYSTIEAIHQTIELIGDHETTSNRSHDHLLYVFDQMVERQLEFIRASQARPGGVTYRRKRERKPGP